MSRSAAGLVVLTLIGALSAEVLHLGWWRAMPVWASASHSVPVAPSKVASVKLWVETDAEDPCEKSTPASGDWMIRNNEDRNVQVVVHRSTTQGNATTEDQMKDILGPRETRELGCETWPGGRQTMTVVAAKY